MEPRQPASDGNSRFVEYRRTRDRSLRNSLVAEHEQLARRLARRFVNRGEPLEDLEQVAVLGLLKAVERFDPEMGAAFATFATPTILGELRRHFRDKGWAVRVPRRVQEVHLAVNAAVGQLTQELGRSPTMGEIAGRIGATVEEVIEGMDAGRAYRAASIDASGASGDDTAAADRVASLGEVDARLALVEDRLTIETLLGMMPERERRILRMRFDLGMTQTQIGNELGMSQMHVSRLLNAGLARLRGHVRHDGNGAEIDDQA